MNTQMNTQEAGRPSTARFLVAALVACGVGAGCEVINPGPVGDEFIALPASQAGFVNGSWERMNRIVGNGAYNEALPAREIFPGGQTGSYGQSVARQAGNMGGWTASGPYNNGQQARWIAEEAVRQFEARGDVSADMMTQAYLAAGYANRMNGDFFCWGVVDSGPLMPGSHYWERAEGHFTNAIAAAPDNEKRYAAYAGRAQARLALEDWAGALSDAQQVPDEFEMTIEMDFSKGGNTAQRNHIFWAGADAPYRSFTVTYTFFHEYFAETGDERTPWREFENPNSRVCVGALQGYGQVPCTQQMKYTSQDDDMRIASGAEMRLVEAEAMLRMNPGNWQAAMALINTLRTSYLSELTEQPLEPWTAANLDDAWTYLMRERGIEFWLESRRFADLRRWEPYQLQYGTMTELGEVLPLEAQTPGTLDWPCFECVMNNPESNMFTSNLRGRPAVQGFSAPRELCYNISTTERNNNPNFIDEDMEDEP
jgi:starch-binding outer membrane protein, SusD/RagB family